MSSGATEYLGLHQWVPDDPFLMKEVNEDNRKIDAELEERPLVKLGDITTTAQSRAVQVDLRQIDKSRYRRIIIECELNQLRYDGVASSYPNNVVTVNGITSNYQTNYMNYSFNSNFDLTRDYFCYACSDALIRFFFHLREDGQVAFECNTISFCGASCHYYAKHSSINAANLSSIKLTCTNENDRIEPGSRFFIYGVRR